MELQMDTDRNGLTRVDVTPRMLEDFLLWRINTGVFFKDGLRLIFDRTTNDAIKLQLMVSPNPDAALFKYGELKFSESNNQWNDFMRSIR